MRACIRARIDFFHGLKKLDRDELFEEACEKKYKILNEIVNLSQFATSPQGITNKY